MNLKDKYGIKRNWTFYLICLFSLCLTTCSKKLIVTKITSIDQIVLEDSKKSLEYKCNHNLAYAPYPDQEHLFLSHQLRLNFHFLNTSDLSHNYTKGEAEKLVKQLVRNANLRLKTNHKMKLPVGNDTEICSPMYQYVLASQDTDSGIYFHADDELCFFANKGKHRNNYNTDVIEKYAIGLDTIINVFFMPHIPEKMRDSKYKVTQTGVALGNGLKIAGFYESGKKPWEIATLLNHEVGHILGLRHSWNTNDGCDDTPKHSNCWSDKKSGDCAVASNNAMDYNNSQMAWTPCQLGQVHRRFNTQNSSQRKLLISNWCDYSQNSIHIEGVEIWEGAKDLNTDLVITDGAELTIKCRLHLAKGAKIIVKPGGRLILDDCQIHNDCGDQWNGIEILSKGNKKGEILGLNHVRLENIKL